MHISDYETRKIIESRTRKELRNLMWERHPHCYLCLRKIGQKERATLDHYIPRNRGGEDNVSNYELSCAPCNSLKSDNTPEQFLAILESMVHSLRFRVGAKGGLI